MARVFIDGFEDGTFNLWVPTGVQTDVITSTPGLSGSVYKLNQAPSGTSYLSKLLPDATSYYIAFKMTGKLPYSDSSLFTIKSGSTILATLAVPTNGYLKMILGSAGANLGTFSTAISSDGTTVNNIEIYYKPSTVTEGVNAGRCIVKLNGITQFDFTGATAPSTSPINAITLGPTPNSIWPLYWDDIVVDDSEWPGNTRIQALKPNAAGTNSGFTPSTAAVANYTMVDEVPASTADYVYTNVPDTLDLYNMTAFVPPQVDVPWKIKCVQAQALAAYEGLSPVGSVQLVVKSGATVNPTDASNIKALSTVYNEYGHLWETNPATGLPWTVAELDAMEVGIRAKA